MIKTVTWVIVSVILVGGGYYALNSDSPLDDEVILNQNEKSNSEEQNYPEVEGEKIAFSQFLKQGGSYKCEVNQYVNGNDSKGITYLNDGMVRGEYNSKVENLNIDSTFIVRDGYTYSWTSMTPTMGFKVKVLADGGVNTNIGTSDTYSWNAEQVGDYNCVVWTADSSKFVVPANINFEELNK